jgi:hypothetical protein
MFDYMIEQFYVKHLLGIQLFCGSSKCFIGAFFCLLVKNLGDQCWNRQSMLEIQ